MHGCCCYGVDFDICRSFISRSQIDETSESFARRRTTRFDRICLTSKWTSFLLSNRNRFVSTRRTGLRSSYLLCSLWRTIARQNDRTRIRQWVRTNRRTRKLPEHRHRCRRRWVQSEKIRRQVELDRTEQNRIGVRNSFLSSCVFVLTKVQSIFSAYILDDVHR